MKKILKNYLVLLLIAGLIIFADQITKGIIRSSLAYGEVWSPWDWLTPYARIVHWFNTGAAFGLFQGRGMIFTILACVIAIAILFYYPRLSEKEWLLRIALGMQFGGAIGNLIDRLTIGHVIDFISVGTFPVFNIADACITVGVGVMIMSLWLNEKNEKQAKMYNNLQKK
ncbi:MAG TPA: signal peptidase II [Anaerolineae bacterium]|nr:signal peptidase II [Anaerolineae bacterium]